MTQAMPCYTNSLLTTEALTAIWFDLNIRYFGGALPAINLVWSRRLTSSVGMFVSRSGPRSTWIGPSPQTGSQREIRLSLPLITPLLEQSPYGRNELVSTLAHEMIHQWQYDILKRRPNHGTDFLRKMKEINRDGELAITIYHSLQREVLALARFAWRCLKCGRVYRRQRRSIQPRRHYCGNCRGTLQELQASPIAPSSSSTSRREAAACITASCQSGQLELDF